MTTTGGPAIVLLAKLFVHPGRVAEFRRFETEALGWLESRGAG